MADYVANGGLNAALNEAAENPKQGYCWYASIVDALYPWTQYRTSTGATPFANLFGNADIMTAGKWVGASESAILAAIAAGGTGSVSVNAYLDSLNFGPTKNAGGVALTDTSFTVGPNGTVMIRLAGRTEATTFSPVAVAQSRVQQRLDRCRDDQGEPAAAAEPLVDNQFPRHGDRRPRRVLPAPGRGSGLGADQCRGWWNFSSINAAATLDGKNTAATDLLAAAVAAVKANMYTNAQAAGPTPCRARGRTRPPISTGRSR